MGYPHCLRPRSGSRFVAFVRREKSEGTTTVTGAWNRSRFELPEKRPEAGTANPNPSLELRRWAREAAARCRAPSPEGFSANIEEFFRCDCQEWLWAGN